MFVKASNTVILSKQKTQSLDKFVCFGFWDKGGREREREREMKI